MSRVIRWWSERAKARAARLASQAQDELVTAVVLPTDAEARLAVGSLRDAGIPAAVQLDQPVFASSWAEAARVVVRRGDLDKARRLFESPESHH